jgi:hypothetical protein
MPDMTFDENMKNRLLAFQRAHGLAEDGVAGAKVWTKLVEAPAAETAPAQEKPAEQTNAEQKPAEQTSAAQGSEAVPDLGPGAFPLLHALAACGDDPEALQRFLEKELDLDLTEIERTMAAVLDGESS